MRFIKFKEAVGEMAIPGEGQIPFYIEKVSSEASAALMCVELTERDIRRLRDTGNRLYILGPVSPSGDKPEFVKLLIDSPFKAIMNVSKEG